MVATKATDTLEQETAKTAVQLATSIVRTATTTIWNENEVQRAMLKYRESYLERHGQVKVLGMPRPMPLTDIYTAVRVLSPAYLNIYASADVLREQFRQRGDPKASGT